jgi:histidine triad (HIT) family protein
MQCTFCAIARGEAPAQVVYEDDDTIAFMDINPATPGHTLVIPRAHVRNIYGLDEGTAAAIMSTVLRIARGLRDAMQPDGLNVMQANERAAFQSVFHFHFHLVPRWIGDGLRLPWRPKPGDPLAIAEDAARIREALAAARTEEPE